jgi:hypothetical protein
MKTADRQRGQTLILLGAWLFFGGGGATALVAYDRPVADIKKIVKRVVLDEDRRKMILSDIRIWDASQESLDERASAYREELLDSLRNRERRRADLDPTLARLDVNLLEMDRDFLDLRFRVRQQVTPDEWAQIVARPESK